MTPYAELLVRPSDGDDVIRRRFHVLSRTEHPDRNGAGGRPGPRWYALAAAYAAIKTAGARAAWEKAHAGWAGQCRTCSGSGVTGSPAAGGVRLCQVCAGGGRK
jgi:DnaJ-class molecular chaperone